MKKLISAVNSLLFLTLVTSVAYAVNASPLTSSEETTFLDTKDQAIFKLNKSQDFIGVLHRGSASNNDEAHMDLYHFKNVSLKKMDKDQCVKIAEVIFGPLKEISLKSKEAELFDSPRSGKVCKIVLEDPDKNAFIKERHLYVFINNNRTFGLVGRFTKTTAKDDVEDLNKFVKSLR